MDIQTREYFRRKDNKNKQNAKKRKKGRRRREIFNIENFVLHKEEDEVRDSPSEQNLSVESFSVSQGIEEQTTRKRKLTDEVTDMNPEVTADENTEEASWLNIPGIPSPGDGLGGFTIEDYVAIREAVRMQSQPTQGPISLSDL